jgi:hypothetical protein
VLALSFSFGSFMVGQMQHASVVASAVWLPLILALTEFGLRSEGLPRQRYLVLAGLALGVSALGVHMQPVIMSGLCFLGWVGFRMLLPPRRLLPDRAPAGRRLARAALGRLTLAAWAGLLVPLVGMTVAAAQLLPLYELSGASGRAGGWTYRDATDYSLPLPNLITLVFPFFFRDGQGGGWSLWQPWEVTYYAGVVPLALAVLGVLCARRRELLFFVPLVLIATLLALGDYSPLNLYADVWNWPGFNMQRAPARFSYLGVFGIAALAGLGTQTLWENLRSWPSGVRLNFRLLIVWMAGLLAALAALIWHLLAWRAWLEADPSWALTYIEQSYLSLRRDPGVVDSAQKVYGGLWQSLDPTHRHTALPLLLLAALLAVVACWNGFRRLRPLWQCLLVLLVAVDLLTFAHEYHPLVSIDEVADVGATGQFLADQTGMFRIYTHPDVERPRANQLLPWGVAETRAYDPLELSRDRVLIGSVDHVDNWLLDLLGVRYRVLPADQPGLPSFLQIGFNPQHPLVSGSALNPSGQEAWTIPGEVGDELRVVSLLEDAAGIADGEQVAQWTLTDSGGRKTTIPMLAGRDTADWTYDDPAAVARPAHRRATVAFTFDLPFPLASGARHVNLYYAAFALPDRPTITRAEFRQTSPKGRMQVFGFGIFNRDRAQVAQFFDRQKYRTAFHDSEVLVQENRAAFPRAFVVPEAVVARDANSALELLAHGALQPRRQVVLEREDLSRQTRARPRARQAPRTDPLGTPYGDAAIVDYRGEQVAVQAASDGGYLVLTDAYYPGWKAYVDGRETALLRADYLFRAVALPPGRHLVEFRYQPESFEAGLAITRLALLLATLVLLISFIPAGRIARPGSERPSALPRCS